MCPLTVYLTSSRWEKRGHDADILVGYSQLLWCMSSGQIFCMGCLLSWWLPLEQEALPSAGGFLWAAPHGWTKESWMHVWRCPPAPAPVMTLCRFGYTDRSGCGRPFKALFKLRPVVDSVDSHREKVEQIVPQLPGAVADGKTGMTAVFVLKSWEYLNFYVRLKTARLMWHGGALWAETPCFIDG